MSSDSQKFLCNLNMFNDCTFAKIWTTIHKTMVVVFELLILSSNVKQVIQKIWFSSEENWRNKYTTFNDNYLYNFSSFLFCICYASLKLRWRTNKNVFTCPKTAQTSWLLLIFFHLFHMRRVTYTNSLAISFFCYKIRETRQERERKTFKNLLIIFLYLYIKWANKIKLLFSWRAFMNMFLIFVV